MGDPTIRSWRDLVSPDVPMLVAATLALLGGSALTLAIPQTVKKLIDALSTSGGADALNGALAMLLALCVGVAILGFFRAWLFVYAGERVVARLRRALFSRLLERDIAFFDQERTGDLISRLSADTGVLQNAVTANLSMTLRFLLQALGSVAVLFWTSARLTLTMLALVPFAAVGVALFARYVRKLSKKTQDALAAASTVAEEVFSNVRTVRSFARERSEIDRYATSVGEALTLGRRLALAYGSFQGVGGIAAFASISLVLWYGGHLVMRGALSVGTLTSFMFYTFYLSFSLAALAGLYGDYQKAIGASQRVFQLLAQDASMTSGTRELADVVGLMRLEDVVFAYPSRANVRVLSGVALTLEPGKVVALVGPSGGGKSTVAQLVSRFYDPCEGRVSLDGVDIREFDAAWLRKQIGLVAQEPVLFAMSLAENIRYGRHDATIAEVIEAAKAANAHDFISVLPTGYDTEVGERGVRLSGGQRQRVAIARALLKDPKILLLDEATSALDAESEHLVQEALERLMKGRAVMVIAHRLSTVKNADLVVVIDRGQVVESGSHAALVEADGLYRRLLDRQFVSN